MSRPVHHAAVRPFRVTLAASQAHRRHGATPFLGCAVCARIAMTSVQPFSRTAA